jgi:hypothetical protein
MDGIKKAATDAGLFEDTNGKKKGGGAVGAALDEIKAKINNTFATGLKPAFEAIGTIFQNKSFQAGIDGVAQGLVKVTSGFAAAVSQGPGLAAINNIFANVGKGLEAAAPGIQRFTEGILTLVSGISNKFKGFGDWFSNLGSKFADSMLSFTKPGEDGMSRLDHLITNVRAGVEGLTGVFQAFWNQGLKDIQSPTFGQGMTKFFDGVKEFVSNTLPALSSGFKDIAGLLDQLSPLFKLMNLASNAKDAIINPVKAAADAAGRSKESENNGGSWWDQLKAGALGAGEGDQSGQKHGWLAKAYGLSPDQAKKTGEEARDAMTRGLMGNGTAGVPAPPKPPPTKTLFGGAASPADGGGDGKKIMADTQVAIQGAQAAAQTAAPAIQGQFTTALVPLTTMPTTIGTAMTGTTVAVGTQMGAMSAIAGVGSQQTVGAVQANLAPLPGVVNGAFANVGNTISTSWGSAIQTVGTGCNQILVAVASILGQLPMIVAVPFAAMTASIAAQMGVAVTTVATYCGTMVTTALSFMGAMESAGLAIGASFAKGIASSTSLVVGAITALMGAASLPIPHSPAKTGPFSGKGWVLYSGHAIGNDFAKGIDESTGTVVDAATSLMQQLSEAFSKGTDMSMFKGDIKQALDELELKRKELKTQYDGIPKTDKAGRAGVKNQMDQIGALKNQLGLQGDKLKMEDKTAKEADKNNPWKDMPQKMSEGVQGVAQGVAQSYAQDLGISGNGAVQALANYGIGFANKMASQFVFNVSNVDEAMSIKQNQQSKDSLATVGR